MIKTATTNSTFLNVRNLRYLQDDSINFISTKLLIGARLYCNLQHLLLFKTSNHPYLITSLNSTRLKINKDFLLVVVS